jgi:hypothetical protein
VVDRGSRSTECILLLLAMRLASPDCVHINRGNHESALINTTGGFAEELRAKYDADQMLFEYFGEVMTTYTIRTCVETR